MKTRTENLIFFFFILMGLLVPLKASGQTPEESAGGKLFGGKAAATVSIDVTEAYLEDVLKLLSQQTGLSFVASEEVIGRRLTLYLDKVPVEAAIQSILDANFLALRQPSQSTPTLYMVTSSGLPKIGTVTKVYILKYARVIPSAGEIIPTFGLSGSLIVQTLSGDEEGGTGGGGGSGGTPSLSGGVGSAFGGQTQGISTGFMAIIRSILTEHGSVAADPRLNAVIITDVPERFPLIEETIAKIDVKPIQIYIEGEVLEVSLDTLRRLGLEYGSSEGTLGSYTLPTRFSAFPYHLGLLEGASGTPTFGTLAFSDGNIVFRMLATESDVQFLARPRLVTLNNEVTEIRIISEPVISITTSSQVDTGTINEEPKRTTVGTILRVTPIVNENSYITMVLEPEVSKVVASSTFTNQLDPTRRLARTTVMVPDGGTAMVAGLISTENTRTGRRLPVLGDIPLLGLPFKRTDTQRNNTEIIVFITPSIMHEEKPREIIPPIREQVPPSPAEKRIFENHNQKIIRDRVMTETIENILR
ncbi:MAG: hypothetical protein NC910_02030 [Candidatus Omnitrophica bacterium]|nr:hypothetical protein [Candidatus Omnitrophota bacterium]